MPSVVSPWVRLLGPLEVEHGSTLLDLGPRRDRLVFGVLALEAGRTVSIDRLIELGWWNQDPPRTARNSLQVSVSRLRAAVGPAAPIETDGTGYRLAIARERIDMYQFRDLSRTGAGSVEVLRRAEALWRGPVLADAMPDDVRQAVCGGLQAERDTVTEQRIAAELGLGRHAALIGELTDLVRADPVRERVAGFLILALYRTGHVSEALAEFHRIREALAETLGIDPGPELRALEVDMLRREPLLAGPGTPSPVHQLPPELPGLLTRHRAMADLNRSLKQVPGEAPATPIAVISGLAGAGKTALAVHWAHRIAGRFPDGQLYADLHGFDPVAEAADPASVVTGFLAALGVPPTDLPAALDERSARLRSALDGKQMLIVLDNARDCDQVRPLLPGSPGCAVVITSRNQLGGLMVAEGARAVSLPLLDPSESRGLLERRLGRDRIHREPEATADIIDRCGGLPLALSTMAARAAVRPGFPLAAVADGLHTLDLDRAFELSYRALDPPAARLFRLLAAAPGEDFSPTAAASLLGEPVPLAEHQLDRLVEANLLIERRPRRYEMHQLLRRYARGLPERAAAPDAALRRLLDHYLHTSVAAAAHHGPDRNPDPLPPPAAGVTVTALPDVAAARAWFTAEHASLIAAVVYAVDRELDTYGWQLPLAMTDHLDRAGRWADGAVIGTLALRAARRQADPAAEAGTRLALARSLTGLGDHRRALHHLHRALALHNSTADRAGQALAHRGLAAIYGRMSRHRRALAHAHKAWNIYAAAGDQPAQATALGDIGWHHCQLGEHADAAACCAEALAVHQQLGNKEGEARAWHALGYVSLQQGDATRAIGCLGRTIQLWSRLGDRHRESVALTHRGDAELAAGDAAVARLSWRRALGIAESLGDRDAGAIRQRLLGSAGSAVGDLASSG